MPRTRKTMGGMLYLAYMDYLQREITQTNIKFLVRISDNLGMRLRNIIIHPYPNLNGNFT